MNILLLVIQLKESVSHTHPHPHTLMAQSNGLMLWKWDFIGQYGAINSNRTYTGIEIESLSLTHFGFMYSGLHISRT